MKTYLVIIEKAPNNYGAFSPDMLVCVSSGATVEETLKEFREALQAHLELMLEDGEEIPTPRPVQDHIEAYRREDVELDGHEFIWSFIPTEDVVPILHEA
jgi:predicted RNase H-like HicB family nuclease